MPIDIYISTSGKPNPYSQTTQQNQINQQTTAAAQVQQTQTTPDAAAEGTEAAAAAKGVQVGIMIAAVKMASAMTKKYASKAITFYTDQTGDTAKANKYNAMIGNFDIVKETINMIKTYAKEEARVRYERDRAGNSTINGSRYSDE